MNLRFLSLGSSVKILFFVGCLISSALGNIGTIIDDISGMGNGDLAKAREVAKGFANGSGELRYPSTAKENSRLFVGRYTPPVLPDDKKGKYVYGLAIFSDDGCDVTLDGKNVHSRHSKGQALPDHAKSFYVLPCLLTPGKPVDITVNYSNTHFITNGPEPDIDGCSLFVFLTEAPVDMDVDSDNNNGYGSPDRSQAEDSIEENLAKNILPNVGDSDNDGLPDYADGFGLEGQQNSDSIASTLKFVPVKVELKGISFDPSKTRVKFTYTKESEPKIGKGLRVGNEGEAPVMVAQGGMRLWATPADQRKNANPVEDGAAVKGDYIPSGKEVNWKEIVRGNNPREATLYVEYVDLEPPSARGIVRILVEVSQDGNVIVGGESVTVPNGVKVEQRDEFKIDLQYVDVVVKDNIFATGVDDVSRTADESDAGFQKDYWIMAPLQGPALPGGEAFENLSKIRIDQGGIQGKLTSVNATAHEEDIVLNGNFHDVNWRGSGTGINSVETVILKTYGGAEHTALPVKVKAMKYRNVKVIVHSVTGAEIDPATDGFIKLKQPVTVVTKQQIKDKLYEVFSRQINAWFSDLEIIEHTLDWDVAVTSDWGTPESPIVGNLIEPYNRLLDLGNNTEDNPPNQLRPEEAKLLGLIDPSSKADLHVFLVGGCSSIQTHFGAGPYFFPGFDMLAAGRADTQRNVVYIATQSLVGSNAIPIDEYLTTIAHEIGHLFVGIGHPDQGEGVAPLAGTAHVERLMFSNIDGKVHASTLDENLLVKAEWDKAEQWLIANPDQREAQKQEDN